MGAGAVPTCRTGAGTSVMHAAGSIYRIVRPGGRGYRGAAFIDARIRAAASIGQHGLVWRPAADVFDNGTTMVVEIDLPGMSREDISVWLNGSVLTVSGERKLSSMANTSERGHGRFLRTFAVPDAVQPDEIRAAYRRGVLQVCLPRTGSVQRVHVKVETTARG